MRTIKGKITWIDILKPTQADLDILKKHHPFHSIILEELLQPSARARMEHYDSYLFIVYHLPVYDPQLKTSRRAEIDFLVTKDLIITARHEPLEQIDIFLQSLMRDAQLQKELLKNSTFVPLYRIIEHAIEFSTRQLRHIEERVSSIAQEIFNHKEEKLLKEISYIKRDILDYRLIVRPQESMFRSLLSAGQLFWGEKSKVYLSDLLSDNLKVLQHLDNNLEIIESLENTNAQLLNAETNKSIQRFTVLAFLFSLPLFFVFMVSTPFVANHVSGSGFWAVFLVIIVLTGWLAYVFRKKKML